MNNLKRVINEYIRLDSIKLTKDAITEIEKAFYEFVSSVIETSPDQCDLSSAVFQQALVASDILTKNECERLQQFFKGSLEKETVKNIFQKLDLFISSRGSLKAAEVNKIIKSPFDDDFVKVDLEFDGSSQELIGYGMGSIDGSSRGADTCTDYISAPYGDP